MTDYSQYFDREIETVNEVVFQEFLRYYFNNWTPDYFWHIGASSSGKYHPPFVQGEGGLVRHTKAAFLMLEELMQLSSYAYMTQEYKDYAKMAILLHDTGKYGLEATPNKKYYYHHGDVAACNVTNAYHTYFSINPPQLLLMAIRSHMGQWTPVREDKPFTNLDRLVHMADYVSSRSFIDIPQITEEYNKIQMKLVECPLDN